VSRDPGGPCVTPPKERHRPRSPSGIVFERNRRPHGAAAHL